MTDEEAEQGSIKGRSFVDAVAEGAISGGVASADQGAHAALVGAGFGAVAGAASHMFKLGVEQLREATPTQRLEREQERLAAQALVAAKDDVQSKFEELEAQVGPDEAAATVLPTLQRWTAAWTGSEGKKRRVIMAALVSAFDPESYEAAMTHRYFALLDRLDYPEIRQLALDVKVLKRAAAAEDRKIYGMSLSDDKAIEGDAASTSRRTLDGLGLLRIAARVQTFFITSLGLGLIAFIERGGLDATVDDEPSARVVTPLRARGAG